MNPANSIFSALHFSGEWNLWLALPVALAAAGAAWGLYASELARRGKTGLWFLPLLRGLAVMFVVLMLTGPVIQTHREIGTRARLLLYVDSSASMKATDEQMELHRKLRIMRRLDWIKGDAADDRAAAALERLANLRRLLTAVEGDTERDVPGRVRMAQEVGGQVMDHLNELKLPGWGATQAKQFREEINEPLQSAKPDQMNDSAKQQLLSLRPEVLRWEGVLAALMPKQDDVALAKLDAETRKALERFDRTPRWTRLETQMLGGAESLVDKLETKHHVELYALTAKRFLNLWQSGIAGEGDSELLAAPRTLEVAVTNLLTDLSTAPMHHIATSTEGGAEGEKLVVVMFTDGQHNDGESPVEMARMFKERGVSIHVVGLGTAEPARDLAVLKAEGPGDIYPDARVTGKVILHDGMPSGKPFTVRIEHEGQVVWERDYVTARKRRVLPFDFPVKEIVAAAQAAQNRNLRHTNLPLTFQVVVPPIEGEMKDDNNAGTLRVNVVTQEPRVLYVDGRPRWEQRYLKNLLERDERWKVNIMLPKWVNNRSILTRGNAMGQFPATRELLFQYQLIIIGDVPSGLFSARELQWIKDSVQFNGGGVIFIDGRQEGLSRLAAGTLQPLFPVKMAGPRFISKMDMTWRFRGAGGSQAPHQLSGDTASNLRIWGELPGPRWIAVTEKLPGSEVLLEVISGQNTAIPALVFRRYGAGRVLYSAFEESWRWRYNVGDLYHQKFWNQIAKWIMEPPFAVQDAHIALDSGDTTYDVGDTAPIRVRIQDPVLASKPGLKPQALLFRNGKLFGTLPLKADPQSFTFRAESAPLEPGDYEVRVKVPGIPEDAILAHTAFTVAANPFGELGLLHCDELLLRQMAGDSGGAYYREEDMHRLVEALSPYSDGRTLTTELPLWQSYWWFVPIILLLTAEWIIRRKLGLV